MLADVKPNVVDVGPKLIDSGQSLVEIGQFPAIELVEELLEVGPTLVGPSWVETSPSLVDARPNSVGPSFDDVAPNLRPNWPEFDRVRSVSAEVQADSARMRATLASPAGFGKKTTCIPIIWAALAPERKLSSVA